MSAPHSAHAQDVKIPVLVDISAGDPVGNRLAFYLRDEVAKSGLFGTAPENADRGIRVVLVTMDPYASGQSRGENTIYSYVILIRNGPDDFDSFITTYVGACSTDPRGCAADLVGYLGENVEELRQRLRRATALN